MCGRSRPPPAVIHNWIVDTLIIPIECIEGIQLDNVKSKVFVKIGSKEDFENLQPKIVGNYEFEDNRKVKWRIPVREVAETTLVRVSNVPFEQPMNDVINSLAEFGEIITSEFEKWGNGYRAPVKNGIRLFKMILNRPIPSFVKYEDSSSGNIFDMQVWYAGQQRTCRICRSPTHFVRNCPRRRGNPTRQIDTYYKRYTSTDPADFPPLEGGQSGEGQEKEMEQEEEKEGSVSETSEEEEETEDKDRGEEQESEQLAEGETSQETIPLPRHFHLTMGRSGETLSKKSTGSNARNDKEQAPTVTTNDHSKFQYSNGKASEEYESDQVNSQHNSRQQLRSQAQEVNGEAQEGRQPSKTPTAPTPTPFKVNISAITLDANQASLTLHNQYKIKFSPEYFRANFSADRKLVVKVSRLEDYRTLQSFATKEGVPFTVFKLKEEKLLQIVIKNIPSFCSPQQLVLCGYTCGNATPVTKMKTGRKLPIFNITMDKNETNRKFFDMKLFVNVVVKVVKCHPSTKLLQCYNCQEFNHGSSQCQRQLTCLHCSGHHDHRSCPHKHAEGVESCEHCKVC
ncbi:hypothetical protein B566_EDAN009924 [Ephemera danica]|nr:hypothetical protein B566_EDAN009924 [Ephemera danica]